MLKWNVNDTKTYTFIYNFIEYIIRVYSLLHIKMYGLDSEKLDETSTFFQQFQMKWNEWYKIKHYTY